MGTVYADTNVTHARVNIQYIHVVLHFTLILQVNTHCMAKYIDPKISSDSFSEHLYSYLQKFPGGMP